MEETQEEKDKRHKAANQKTIQNLTDYVNRKQTQQTQNKSKAKEGGTAKT